MTDLPDRDQCATLDKMEAVYEAYTDGILKSRDEMDEEAAAMEVVYRHGGHIEDQPLPEEIAHAKRVLDAAWGVDDE